MYYKKKSTVLFRDYESFGFITDNRNFGYKQINSQDNFIGDKVISDTGAVFMAVLGRDPKSIDIIAREISNYFTDTDFYSVKEDIEDFFYKLEEDGFIVSGNSPEECDVKDKRFSYKNFESNRQSIDLVHEKIYHEESTQDFFENYFNGKPQLSNLHIEITSKCNERCLHCYIPHNLKQNHIKPELFLKILDQCKEMRILHLTISGGEPMLHKDFCNFLQKCNEYEFSINILSNLTLLNDSIIQEMKANPLLGVQVSLYSMNPIIHDKITQLKGSFNKTMKGIKELYENEIPMQISCPILQQNKNCYKDVIEWANKYNINVGDDYGIIARYDHTTQNLSYRLSIDEVKELIYNKVSLNDKYIEQIKASVEKKKHVTSNDFVCSVCNSSICITENGNIYPCAGWQDYVVGNVGETSLSDIWDNSEKVQYLRNLRNQDFLKCKQCSDKEFCTMCMVRNANENPKGDPFVVNEYFCNIAKLNRQIMLEWKEKLMHF